MSKENIKDFWHKRAKADNLEKTVSLCNLEPDRELTELKIKLETECVMPKLRLEPSFEVLDLGAGIGQWSFRFAPFVKKVYAVEFVPDFVEMGRKLAAEKNISNTEFIVSAAEEYYEERKFDMVFISGLFLYLNDEQAARVTDNVSKMLESGAQLFLRDGTSILKERHEINDKFSEILQSNYSALYRTREEYISLFNERGFALKEDGQVFEEGCVLNKYPETRLRYYSWEKL